MPIQMFSLGPQPLDFTPLASLGSNFVKGFDSARKNAREDRKLQLEEQAIADAKSAMTGIFGPDDSLASVATKGRAAGPSFGTDGGGFVAKAPPSELKGIIDANVPEADREYAYRMAQKESSFNPSAVSPTGARGLFQFTGGTGRQYGLIDRAGDIRDNPTANTQAFVRFTEDNRNALRQGLGREPTHGELALAHQQGAGGALALLTGQGDIDPNNLRVNNVDPSLGRSAQAQRIMAYYGYGGSQPPAQSAGVQVAAAPAGVQSVSGDDPARLRADAQFYEKTNPEAARQFLARANAAEGNGKVAQADLPPRGSDAAPAQGIFIPPGNSGAGAVQPNPANPPAQSGVQGLSQRAQLILRTLANPYLPDGPRDALKVLLAREMKTDELRAVDSGTVTNLIDSGGKIRATIPKQTNPLDDESKRADIDLKRKNLTKSDATTNIQEYEYAVSQGETRSFNDWSAARAKAGSAGEEVTSLRKEVQQLPSYKNMAQAAPIYKSMLETAGRNTKASDLNMVYALGKLMDPTSVVREGEMVMVRNSAGLSENLLGAINSLNGGAALTPETRQALMQEAYSRMQSYKQMFDQDASQYDGIIQRRGINRADVLPDFGTFTPYDGPKKAPPPPPRASSAGSETPMRPADDRYVRPDGSSPPTPSGDKRVRTTLPVRIQAGMTPDQIRQRFAPGTRLILPDGSEGLVR